jgi:hypothetical protein
MIFWVPQVIQADFRTASTRDICMQKIATQLHLSRGQVHDTRLRRGQVIGVTAGTVNIIRRICLEHEVMTLQTPVQRGGVFGVPVSGRFEISAQSDAVITLR